MNRSCVVFLVVVVCVTSVTYGEIIKCCESNYSFEKVNGTFNCSDIPSNNSHIFTNTTNFLENNTEGQCVEFFENFYIFNISKSAISQFQTVEEKKVYSKCCPLNFLYNTHTHGCEEAENVDNSEIKFFFIKVGLPTCEVIVDEIVDNTTEEFDKPNCVDRTTNGSFILRKCKTTQDICSEMRCVQKCCPDGQIFFSKYEISPCIEGYQGINLTELTIRGASEFPEDPFATVVTNKFSNIFLLNESFYPSYFNRKGIFSYSFNVSRTINQTSGNYCVEYVKSRNGYFFYLTPDTSVQDEYNYYSYIQLISAILLAITIFVYFLLNEVEKMFGKILVNYCLAVLIWYAQLAYFYITLPEEGCLRVAFIVMFARTAAFVWSTILCWDIWRTFGSTNRNNDTFRKGTNYKKIILYCLYSWGASAVLMLIIFLFYTYNEILPDVIQPHIAEETCFFDFVPGNYSQLLFLDIPTILLQVVNIALFVKTTMYCLKVKNEINKMVDNADKKEQFKRNKAKLYLILKLLLIMGVTFITEAITTSVSMVDPITIHIDRLFNIINAAQGIFIFIIFICNQQMYNNIKKKLGISNAICRTSIQSVATQSSTASDQSSKKNTSKNTSTSRL